MVDNNGGPAFPRTGEGFGNPKYDTPGMTLRDYFASQALIGIISKFGYEFYSSAAKDAYDFADMMLDQREVP